MPCTQQKNSPVPQGAQSLYWGTAVTTSAGVKAERALSSIHSVPASKLNRYGRGQLHGINLCIVRKHWKKPLTEMPLNLYSF